MDEGTKRLEAYQGVYNEAERRAVLTGCSHRVLPFGNGWVIARDTWFVTRKK